MHLLMSPASAGTLRRLSTVVADAVRSVIAPATLVHDEPPATAPAPVGRCSELNTSPMADGDLPTAEAIEAAAAEFDRAADQARQADRGKRAARKILDRLPAGTYGPWVISRVASTRQTADLDEIRRIFKAHGLGPVPMKATAASLKVKRAEVVTAATVETAA
ncbi:hypothetical protein [Streptomyces sp. NPDC053079]|uniref:hypothetical protein n=1 Tax=Streptomyces sp. NPDC053079 TaxID=3365697 RepID=UPI0037D6314F